MKHFIVLFFASTLCMACDKKDSTPPPPPKEPVAAKAQKIEKPKAEAIKTPPKATPEATGPKMATLHKELKAGKKISAIREYRKLYRSPLAAGKVAVELEQHRLGLPSVYTVYGLIWDGKEKEATALIQRVFKSLSSDKAASKIQEMKQKVGPATEKSLQSHMKNGKLHESILVYHRLNPKLEIHDVYKVLAKEMKLKTY
jgi:hypothetical protein